MKRFIPLFLLLLTSSYTIAENIKTEKPRQKYDVNIIIFEDAHGRYLNAEQWNSDAAAEVEESLGNEVQPADTQKESHTDNHLGDDFENIKPEILNHEYKRVNASSNYNVLFYGGWRQTGLDKNHTYEIDIKQLENRHKSTSKNNISGYLKLVLARYLHISGQLKYEREIAITKNTATDTTNPTNDNADNDTNNKGETFTIHLQRKMRSKTLHYIDHPMVGILVQINPTKMEVEE